MVDEVQKAPIRVAVVGTGLSGLVAAWSLSEPNIRAEMGNPNLEIHLFEKSTKFGVAAMSVDLKVPGRSQRVKVDIPYRATLDSFYPALTALVNYFNVGRIFTTWRASWSWRSGPKSDDPLKFITKSPERVDGEDTFDIQANWLPSWKSLKKLNSGVILRNVRILLQLLKLTAAVGWDWSNLKCGRLSHITFEEYLRRPWLGMDDEFINMVMSFCATFCSCSVRAMCNYPASLILAFYASTIGTHRTFIAKWVRTTKSDIGYRFKDGIITLARKCVQHISKDNLHFSTTVTNLSRVNGKILLEYTSHGKKSILKVDRVVLATEVQYAWPLLKNLPKLTELRHALQSWKHEHSSIVMHTDANGCMPKTDVWSSLNEVLCPVLADGKDKTAKGGTEAFVTCWINNCDKNYAKTDINIFQTWQPMVNKDEMFPYYKPDEKKVLLPPALVSRPIPTVETVNHLAMMHKYNHQHGVHVCGSYSQLVVPLLESCTTSALKAGRAVFMSLMNDSTSKERFNNSLKKLLGPKMMLLEWNDTATACCVPSEPIGVCENMLLSIVFCLVSLLLTVSQLLSGTTSDGKALHWEWCPSLAPLASLPLLVCGVLSSTGYVSHFIGMLGYIVTTVLLWLYATSLILSSLNRSKRSIYEKWDVLGLLLIAEVSSGLCFYYTIDYLANQTLPGGNVLLQAYISMTHSDHWIWSNRVLSITVVWAICLTIKPLQPSIGGLTGHSVDSHLWRRMLRTTGGLGPLIFLALGFVLSISASLAFFLCYLSVLSFEEPKRTIKRPSMYKTDKLCSVMLAVFILVAGFGGVITLRYTEANSWNYIVILGLIHAAIFSPGIFWAARDFEFEPVGNGSYAKYLVPTILALSWVIDLCAIRETLDLMEVWKADVSSCQLRVALDGVFAMIALVIWQRSVLRTAAVMIFPGASLAFNALYDDLNGKQVNLKGVLPNLN